MKKTDFNELFSELLKLFPNPDTELKFSNPYQLLVAVMLSAQTTDKQVNKITSDVFEAIKQPKDLLKYSDIEVEKMFSSVNYYKMKSKHIIQTSKIIDEKYSLLNKDEINNLNDLERIMYDEFGYYIPEDKDKLKQFPGVGEKTAKVFLYVQYHHPLIAVDTHVHRVANRLGLVNTKEALETSEQIEIIIPNHWKSVAHHVFILFGRYYCMAKNPKCEECVVKKICKFYKNK